VVEDQAVADVVDAPGVERAAPAHEPVHLVPLLEEELGEIGAVLARDPGDERLARGHADLLPVGAKSRFYGPRPGAPSPGRPLTASVFRSTLGHSTRKGADHEQ